VLALLGFLTVNSFAQEEVCGESYNNERLLGDLDAIDASFRVFDRDDARDRLTGAHRSLLCLNERVDSLAMARLSRQLALTFFFDQDEDAMRRWSMLSRHLEPDLPWYADMAEDHPFRVQSEGAKIPDKAGPDSSLVPPKRGGVFWNGQFVDSVQAPMEMPALVQTADKDGVWIRAWWQDGSAWPEHVLGPPGNTPSEPKWLEPASPDQRHVAHASQPLFSDAPTPPPAAPAKPKTYTEAEIVAAKVESTTGEYRDPFQEARRRAIRRESYETVSTNDDGDQVTVKTEVITYRRDRSGGQPVTYEIFGYWMRDGQSWVPRDGALRDWVDERPPPNASRLPVVWVSAEAALAYCGSFGLDLATIGGPAVEDPLKFEWRSKDGLPVLLNAKGKTQSAEPTAMRDDTGFRCEAPAQ
jgi:hypothetical protein